MPIDEIEQILPLITVPLKICGKQTKCLGRIKTGSVSQYSENRGIIFNGLYYTSPLEILPQLKDINPLVKIIIFVREISITNAKSVLESCWNQYKLLNLMIISMSPVIFHLMNPYNSTFMLLPLNDDSVNAAKLINGFIEYRRTNLQLFPLKINAFDTTKFCKITNATSGGGGVGVGKGDAAKFQGICGETIAAIKKAINCSIQLIPPLDDQEYGFVGNNGTYLGSLGEIEYGRVDVAANVRLVADFSESKNLLFIHPLYDLKYCFLVPYGYYEVNFEVLPHKFIDHYAFIIFIISIASLIIVEYVIQRIPSANKNKNNHSDTLVEVTLRFFSLYCNVSTRLTPTLLQSRMLYGTMLMAVIILTNCFQGSIIERLNQDENSKNIETIQQLIDSDLVIRIPSGPDKYIRDFADFPKDSIQKRLFDRKIVTETMSAPQIKYVAITREAVSRFFLNL